jgi:hypothetical protein
MSGSIKLISLKICIVLYVPIRDNDLLKTF